MNEAVNDALRLYESQVKIDLENHAIGRRISSFSHTCRRLVVCTNPSQRSTESAMNYTQDGTTIILLQTLIVTPSPSFSELRL